MKSRITESVSKNIKSAQVDNIKSQADDVIENANWETLADAIVSFNTFCDNFKHIQVNLWASNISTIKTIDDLKGTDYSYPSLDYWTKETSVNYINDYNEEKDAIAQDTIIRFMETEPYETCKMSAFWRDDNFLDENDLKEYYYDFRKLDKLLDNRLKQLSESVYKPVTKIQGNKKSARQIKAYLKKHKYGDFSLYAINKLIKDVGGFKPLYMGLYFHSSALDFVLQNNHLALLRQFEQEHQDKQFQKTLQKYNSRQSEDDIEFPYGYNKGISNASQELLDYDEIDYARWNRMHNNESVKRNISKANSETMRDQADDDALNRDEMLLEKMDDAVEALVNKAIEDGKTDNIEIFKRKRWLTWEDKFIKIFNYPNEILSICKKTYDHPIIKIIVSYDELVRSSSEVVTVLQWITVYVEEIDDDERWMDQKYESWWLYQLPEKIQLMIYYALKKSFGYRKSEIDPIFKINESVGTNIRKSTSKNITGHSDIGTNEWYFNEIKDLISKYSNCSDNPGEIALCYYSDWKTFMKLNPPTINDEEDYLYYIALGDEIDRTRLSFCFCLEEDFGNQDYFDNLTLEDTEERWGDDFISETYHFVVRFVEYLKKKSLNENLSTNNERENAYDNRNSDNQEVQEPGEYSTNVYLKDCPFLLGKENVEFFKLVQAAKERHTIESVDDYIKSAKMNESVQTKPLNEEKDLSDYGEIQYSIDFDEDFYKEWLENEELPDTLENKERYAKEECEFDIEYLDNITFHECGRDTFSYNQMIDEFGERIGTKMFTECMKDGSGSFEVSCIYDDEKFDVNDSDALNRRAKQILSHGEYYRNCRGYILTDGTFVYTPNEHNQATQIEGVTGTYHFIQLGNIRLLNHSLDFGKLPTESQYNTLRRVIAKNHNETLYVDFMYGPQGNKSKVYEYPMLDVMKRDLEDYYINGTLDESVRTNISKANSSDFADQVDEDTFGMESRHKIIDWIKSFKYGDYSRKFYLSSYNHLQLYDALMDIDLNPFEDGHIWHFAEISFESDNRLYVSFVFERDFDSVYQILEWMDVPKDIRNILIQYCNKDLYESVRTNISKASNDDLTNQADKSIITYDEHFWKAVFKAGNSIDSDREEKERLYLNGTNNPYSRGKRFIFNFYGEEYYLITIDRFYDGRLVFNFGIVIDEGHFKGVLSGKYVSIDYNDLPEEKINEIIKKFKGYKSVRQALMESVRTNISKASNSDVINKSDSIMNQMALVREAIKNDEGPKLDTDVIDISEYKFYDCGLEIEGNTYFVDSIWVNKKGDVGTTWCYCPEDYIDDDGGLCCPDPVYKDLMWWETPFGFRNEILEYFGIEE